MTLTLAQIFGSNVSLDLTTPTLPKLVIDLKDFQNIENPHGGDITDSSGFDDVGEINDTNKDLFASKILSSILKLHYQNQPANNTDETIGTYITTNPNTSKTFITRNGVRQIAYPFSVNVYVNDPTSIVDADNVVS